MINVEELKFSLGNFLKVFPSDFEKPINRLEAYCTAEYENSLSKLQQNAKLHLIEQIKSEPTLEILNSYMQKDCSVARRITYEDLAQSLIVHALEVGVVQALSDLKCYVENDYFLRRQMMFIGGVEMPYTIKLTNELSLIKFDGRDKRNWKYLPGGYIYNLTPKPISDPDLAGNIVSAITKDFKHPKIHSKDGVGMSLQEIEMIDFEELEDVFLCLTLVSKIAPVKVATSTADSNWMPAGFTQGLPPQAVGTDSGGTGYVSPPEPIGVPQRRGFQWYGSYKLEDDNEINRLKDIHKHFVSLPPSIKTHLRLPMKRLSMAKLRQNRVDSAIDLGIVFESLFADGKPHDSSIGFTMRLRAVRLLRESVDDRKALAKILKDFYSLRSKAAHEGELRNISINKTRNLISQATKIAASAIEYFIMNGKPDWDSVIYG